ncbi:MAG: histidine ammonia-lyase [Pseudomonadota bacterium]
MVVLEIDGNGLTLEDVVRVALRGQKVKLRPDSLGGIMAAYREVEKAIERNLKVYGVTTGLGHLSEVRISRERTKKLQENLILSHCSGVGDEFPVDICRAMMLLRANALAKGFSGVRPGIIEGLLTLLNAGVTPVIYKQGSVGASGDLVPLAHMALLLTGRGQARLDGKLISGAEGLKVAGLEPTELEAKEALALVNGTQAMAAVCALTLARGLHLVKVADIAGAMSLEALGGTAAAFDPRIHRVRPIPGQGETAENILRIVQGSSITPPHLNSRVQDAYSLRCMPQVHGSVREVLKFARYILEIELNSATDNPLVFPEDGVFLSGGNFHGEPLAFIGDFMGIALSELANISDRRCARLTDPHCSDLPPSLSNFASEGNCFGILQIVTASLVSDNKTLAHPASVDSVPTSANQEDHVSMGLNAARKAHDISNNLENVLAIECICAAQALAFVGPERCGRGTRAAHEAIRTRMPWVDGDAARIFSDDIRTVREFVSEEGLVRAVVEAVGELH